METTGYDLSSNLSGEEEVTKKQLVTIICETLDNVAEDLYRIQQDVALLGDSPTNSSNSWKTTVTPLLFPQTIDSSGPWGTRGASNVPQQKRALKDQETTTSS
jgi:hypothetical protein